MNLRQIEVFRAIMLAGSVTDAARMLHVSQPGISRMLGHIEAQLNVKLFERQRGKLAPTGAAQALFVEVERVYRGVMRIDAVARALQRGSGQVLRVLSSPSMALQLVPDAVARTARRFPQARFYMETQLVREMVGQLVRHEADIGICTLPVSHGLLESEPIGAWSLCCVFPTGHRFTSRREVRMRDVLQEPLIGFSDDTPQGRFIAEAMGETEAAPPLSIEVRSGQIACALVASGAGVAVVDRLTARAWHGQLEARPIREGPVYPVHAVRHRNLPASDMANHLVEVVRAQLRSKPPGSLRGP